MIIRRTIESDPDVYERETLALGEALLAEYGLNDWKIVIACEDFFYAGEPDDYNLIGSRGRCLIDAKLILISGKYVTDATFVREILLHEITHALLGPEGSDHGDVFQAKLLAIGGQPYDPNFRHELDEEEI